VIEGYRPGPVRVDPVGVAPAEVVALAARCELLEAAMVEVERLASVAHDAIWHPDVQGTDVLHANDRADSAQSAIWAIHNLVRPLLSGAGHECRGESAGRTETAGRGSVGERQGRQPAPLNNAERCELLEAVAEAAWAYRAAQAMADRVYSTREQEDEARERACALDAALVAAGATGKAGT
jgi:hypothetical protein